ncbi:MAG: PilN domain-containing protein [Gammaproteobacteria bacterium]|nr:PilN domain-containing protein [Gammaproteobacteria bacterium]MBT8063926.1 PilN domain-containing protein [Gammaproteobacteria bacterium]NNK34373.1 PilN domain-containing protein [Xanthomonadales bacterium]
MFSLIKEKLQQLWGRFQAGPVGSFFRWWTGELKQAMPAAWREKLLRAFRRVTVQLDDAELLLGVDENRLQSKLQALSLSQDVSVQKQQVADVLEANDLAEAPRFLLLNKGTVLSKQISLPQAAEPNLAQVLSFEMDRQTPFKASAVYFDWNVLERGGPTGQLRLELFVVPRGEVDEAMKLLDGRGFTLAGVDVVEEGRTLGLNLLPAALRTRTINRKARLNYALGALALLLLAAVMAQSLYLRAHQVDELEGAIAQVQGEARKVMRIKEQIEDTSEAAGFLARRRAETPLAIELLADVTRLLPDDTYLDRLVIGRDSVQLQGKSQNAQRLIERVNESDLLDDAAFRGSTRLDARSGLEIFEVNAAVVAAGGE